VSFPSFSFLRPFLHFWLLALCLAKTLSFRPSRRFLCFVALRPRGRDRRGTKDSFFSQKKEEGADIVTSFIQKKDTHSHIHTNKKKKKEEKRSGERGERETSLNLARIYFFSFSLPCFDTYNSTTTRAEKEERVCISRRPTASLRF